MVSASRIQILLMCAKAQERHLMLLDGFSIGYIWLGMTNCVCSHGTHCVV